MNFFSIREKIKIKLFIFLLKIPINKRFFLFLEKYINYSKGQGWPFSSIEIEVNSCFSLLKNEPKIFIDIGAHKGEYLEALTKRYHKAEYHIFEPSIKNYQFLRKRFNKKHYKINNLALSSVSKQGILYSNFYGSAFSSLYKRNLDNLNIKFEKTEEIKILRFDEYWKDINSIIDYVKIDVEGHELDVLKGFGELIKKVKLIQFEFGGANIDSKTYLRDFWEFFSKKNFCLYRITPKGNVLLNEYHEKEENFLWSNYIATNKSL
tara:strand:- start:11 stop:802 length:792 start_codon:yes stop_codon:yes gene_type:complete